jgi:hypothetical protein
LNRLAGGKSEILRKAGQNPKREQASEIECAMRDRFRAATHLALPRTQTSPDLNVVGLMPSTLTFSFSLKNSGLHREKPTHLTGTEEENFSSRAYCRWANPPGAVLLFHNWALCPFSFEVAAEQTLRSLG